MKLDAGSFENHDGDAELGRVLLETEIAVGRQEDIEIVLFGQREQLPFWMPLQPIFATDAKKCPVKARPSRQFKHSSIKMRTMRASPTF